MILILKYFAFGLGRYLLCVFYFYFLQSQCKKYFHLPHKTPKLKQQVIHHWIIGTQWHQYEGFITKVPEFFFQVQPIEIIDIWIYWFWKENRNYSH